MQFFLVDTCQSGVGVLNVDLTSRAQAYEALKFHHCVLMGILTCEPRELEGKLIYVGRSTEGLFPVMPSILNNNGKDLRDGI